MSYEPALTYMGVVVARFPDTDAPTPAGTVLYAARAAVGDGDAFLSIAATKPQRPYHDDELIIPAKPGTPCIIGRLGARNVLWITERPAIAECETEP